MVKTQILLYVLAKHVILVSSTQITFIRLSEPSILTRKGFIGARGCCISGHLCYAMFLAALVCLYPLAGLPIKYCKLYIVKQCHVCMQMLLVTYFPCNGSRD